MATPETSHSRVAARMDGAPLKTAVEECTTNDSRAYLVGRFDIIDKARVSINSHYLCQGLGHLVEPGFVPYCKVLARIILAGTAHKMLPNPRQFAVSPSSHTQESGGLSSSAPTKREG
jgi:hypothetical protein